MKDNLSRPCSVDVLHGIWFPSDSPASCITSLPLFLSSPHLPLPLLLVPQTEAFFWVLILDQSRYGVLQGFLDCSFIAFITICKFYICLIIWITAFSFYQTISSMKTETSFFSFSFLFKPFYPWSLCIAWNIVGSPLTRSE